MRADGVTAILGERREEGVKEYLVQWSGVDESGQKWPDSWQPANDVTGCAGLLKAWWLSKKKKKKNKGKSA